MCNLSDGVEYRGILKGREEERKQTARSVRSLISKTGVSLQQALELLDIPQEKWALYTRLVEES